MPAVPQTLQPAILTRVLNIVAVLHRFVYRFHMTLNPWHHLPFRKKPNSNNIPAHIKWYPVIIIVEMLYVESKANMTIKINFYTRIL